MVSLSYSAHPILYTYPDALSEKITKSHWTRKKKTEQEITFSHLADALIQEIKIHMDLKYK